MKLGQWLKENSISRLDFSRIVGLSPASITALCNDETVWISRDSAQKILQATGGQVTPNDFLGQEYGQMPRHPFYGLIDMNEAQTNVAEAIRAFKQGEIVVVTDDDDRENEGDLMVAAAHVTAEQMAFIIRHTAGIVCAPISTHIARKLRFEPMVAANNSAHETAFTITVDYRHGVTSGVSAAERASTIRALIDPNSGPDDFLRPGHVFPLIALEGGVLIRSGHTEAAVDLCQLADLPQAAAICELVNDDGTLMRGEQVTAFAKKHQIKKVSVSELIAWRQRNERLVERVSEQPVRTPAGMAKAIAYALPYDSMHHVGLVFGDILDGKDIPVRFHSESVMDDVFGPPGALDAAMQYFAEHGRGVIVYLREGAVGVGRRMADASEAAGDVSEQHQSARQRHNDWREIGIGAQILNDLGVHSIHLLASRQRHYVGLEGFGITIEKTELLDQGQD